MLGDLHILSRENRAGWERSIQVQRFDLFLSHTWLTNGRPGPEGDLFWAWLTRPC